MNVSRILRERSFTLRSKLAVVAASPKHSFFTLTHVTTHVDSCASMRSCTATHIGRYKSTSEHGSSNSIDRKLTDTKHDTKEEDDNMREGNRSIVHFRATVNKHPLKTHTWKNPAANHIWSESEIKTELSAPVHHKPSSFSDWTMFLLVRGLYHGFNFATGFNKKDPTPQSCEYRLLILESIAGVPGMVAGGLRHFKSLRNMKRDHGWIHTLLEEAENERMHLLVFMKMFQPGLATRAAVISGQVGLVGFLTLLYLLHPRSVHRMVGYIEETAVDTYTQIIDLVETPGSKLHEAWKDLEAPNIAKQYWRMSDDASFLDVVKQIAADETHHRDVNHTFASMKSDDPNPYVHRLLDDAKKAWQDEPGQFKKKV